MNNNLAAPPTFLERHSSILSKSFHPHHNNENSLTQKHMHLFTSNMNQSNVFKELIPNPSSRENIKRSLEIHLEDISSTCTLRDFYRLKEVYQRNNFCKITGVHLEVKDLELAANFLVSNTLQAPTDTLASKP